MEPSGRVIRAVFDVPIAGLFPFRCPNYGPPVYLEGIGLSHHFLGGERDMHA